MDDHALMGLALDEARAALDAGHFPVGAVLALDGAVLGRARKTMGSNHLDHAETNLFRQVFAGDYPWRRGAAISLYTTLEPCIMCWGMALHLPLARVVYAMPDAYGGCTRSGLSDPPPRHRDRRLAVQGGVRREEARALFAASSIRPPNRSGPAAARRNSRPMCGALRLRSRSFERDRAR